MKEKKHIPEMEAQAKSMEPRVEVEERLAHLLRYNLVTFIIPEWKEWKL